MQQRDNDEVHNASMGPRSSDRGNGSICPTTVPTLQLQWGRGRVTAETAKGPLLLLNLRQLQWGRGRVTAETSPMQTICPWALTASMGPRSSDRGNWHTNETSSIFGMLQWGRG